jgi:hypothetical protein
MLGEIAVMSMQEPAMSVEQAAELQAYREYVKQVATAEDAQEIIFNRSIQHAAVIIEFMFAKAQRSIEILTGELLPAVYGTPEVIEIALKFLSGADANISVVSEHPIDTKTHPLFVAARKFGLIPKMHLWLAPRAVRDTYPYHFILADGRHFRFEKSRDSHEALVQYGLTVFGPKLQTIFGDLKRRSDIIPLS